jgi:anti-sigma factor RsiW
MSCDEIRRWISPYLDSELDSHTNFEIAQHLEACAACRQVFEAERQLEASVAASLTTDPHAQAAWDRAVGRALSGGAVKPRRWQLAVAAAALLVGLVGGWRGWVVAHQDLVRAAFHNHQTYLANRMTLDVQSSSPEAAEAFFVNKLLFPVRCPRNLGDQGIRLIGARLCHLKQVPVAYLLYHVDSRPISVFLLDADDLGRFRQAAALDPQDSPRGYRLGRSGIVTVRSAHGVVCAVGEVPQAALERIVVSYASGST